METIISNSFPQKNEIHIWHISFCTMFCDFILVLMLKRLEMLTKDWWLLHQSNLNIFHFFLPDQPG